MSSFMSRTISRRRAIAGLGTATAAALIAPRSVLAAGEPRIAVPPSTVTSAVAEARHLAWVWQFKYDGDPAQIRDTLAANGMGVILKTHDGANWMSKYDQSRDTVSGPASVEKYARLFEQAGVPFHAWAVVKGNDIARETQIASDVLNAGARSLFLDLEPHTGFWVGGNGDGARYGDALRRMQPNARLSTSIDPRPWVIDAIPLRDFASFTDEISPQVYWQTFSTAPNVTRYRTSGNPVGAAGVTPEFVLSAAMTKLRAFGRPIHPVGDGTAVARSGWAEFVDASYGAQAESVSVWRYGVADPAIWEVLRSNPPQTITYIVQPGDTLGAIASRNGMSVAALAEMNGIANPNSIVVGARLRIRGGGGAVASSAAPASSGQTHVVQAGETLGVIAGRYGSSVAAITRANGIVNANLIRVGQSLLIP